MFIYLFIIKRELLILLSYSAFQSHSLAVTWYLFRKQMWYLNTIQTRLRWIRSHNIVIYEYSITSDLEW